MPTLAEQAVQRWNMERTYGANLERQKRALKLIEYYEGEQIAGLEEALSAQFADPKALKLQKNIDNLVRFIGDEISRVFDSNPVVTSEDEKVQAFLADQLEDGILFLLFKLGEVYANLTEVCAIHPYFDEGSGKIKNRLLPNHSLWVIQNENDPTMADSVIYQTELRDTVTLGGLIRFTFWGPDNVYIFDNSGVKSDETINPYGLLPFAWLRSSVAVDSFFPTISDHLAISQDTQNVLLTELNQLVKMQSFSQPVMKGMNDVNQSISVDPSRPIKIGRSMRDETPPDFAFVTPDAKILEVLEAVDRNALRAVTRYGISPQSFRSESTYSSGYAMRIANKRLDRRREDSIPLSRSAIVQWFDIVRAIHNYHKPDEALSEEATINIDFSEPQYEEDPGKQADIDKKRIDMGLDNPVRLLMRDNPDLSEEEAKRQYEENLAYKRSVSSRFGLSGVLAAANPATDEPAQ